MSAALAVLGVISPFIDKILSLIPDPNAKAKYAQEYATMQIQIAAEQAAAQTDLNKTEAQHPSLFVAGWRPFIGWVGGFALAWTFILYPLLVWGAGIWGYVGPLPTLETSELMALVFSMLGVGAMRSFDKMQGTETRGVVIEQPNSQNSQKSLVAPKQLSNMKPKSGLGD